MNPTIISRILLATDKKLWMEELAVRSRANFINWLQTNQHPLRTAQLNLPPTYRGVKIYEDGSRDVFATACLREKGLKRAPFTGFGGIRVRAPIVFDTVLEEVPELALGNSFLAGMASTQQDKSELTAPKRCFPAGYPPGRCECGKSVHKHPLLLVWLFYRAPMIRKGGA